MFKTLKIKYLVLFCFLINFQKKLFFLKKI
jgi:hypothetical protein